MQNGATKRATSSDPTTEFIDGLREFLQAARRARGRAAQQAPSQGLSLAQFHLLEPLAGGPLANGQLAEAAGVAPATATRMLDALVARGLVTRSEDDVDRRAVIIALTDAGHAALAEKRKEHRAVHRKIAAAFDKEEQRVAAAVLRRLAEVIEEL